MENKNLKSYFFIITNILLLYKKIVVNNKICAGRKKLRQNLIQRPKYLQLRVVSHKIESILNGSDTICKKNLRVSHSTYQKILQVMPHKRSGWSVEYEIIIFLYWMAAGCSYRVTGDFAGLSRHSVRNIIIKQLDFFCSEMLHIVHTPPLNELDEVGAKFCLRAKTQIFKNAVGAIDGCHIRIKCPINRHDEYINYKKFYSIILQAIVDSQGSFIDIFIGYPGSVHDTRVLHNSPIYKRGAYPPQNYYLLGDGGYACRLNPCAIITPYKNPNADQRKFNTAHSKARNVVECAFGIMKNRWRNIFFKALEQNIDNSVKIIATACILHNICVMGDDYNENIIFDFEGEAEARTNSNRSRNLDNSDGILLRDNLLQQLLSENQ